MQPFISISLIFAFLAALNAPVEIVAKADAVDEPLPVKARPRMVGELVPNYTLKNPQGETVQLASILKGKLSALAFTGRVTTQNTATQHYFNTIRPFIEELGYQLVLVAPVPPASLLPASQAYKHRIVLSDESRESFISMGLADTTRRDEPVTTGFFLVDENQRIIFEFASVRNSISISGEVLVLAAKQYRDLSRSTEKKH